MTQNDENKNQIPPKSEMKNYSLRIDDALKIKIDSYSKILQTAMGVPYNFSTTVRYLLANNKDLQPNFNFAKLDNQSKKVLMDNYASSLKDIREYLKNAYNIGNNLNQMAKKVNEDSSDESVRDLSYSIKSEITKDQEANAYLHQIANQLEQIINILTLQDVIDNLNAKTNQTQQPNQPQTNVNQNQVGDQNAVNGFSNQNS